MMKRPSHLVYAAFFILPLFTQLASASEMLGQWSIQDFYLSPRFHLQPQKDVGFELNESLLSMRWTNDDFFSAQIAIGTPDQRPTPLWYKTPTTLVNTDFLLTEAFVQAQSIWGAAALGLVPIPFGGEGADHEREFYFPRSLFYQKHLLPLRDFGLRLSTQESDISSRLALINGEGQADQDNNLWFVTQLQWGTKKDLMLRIGGAVGYTTSAATGAVPQNSEFTEFDPQKNTKIRFTHFTLSKIGTQWSSVFEGILGDYIQENKKTSIQAGHFDLIYHHSNKWLNLLLRMDFFDPNQHAPLDNQTQTSVGIAMSRPYRSNEWIILATQIKRQDQVTDDYTGQVIWRYNPKILSL